MEISVHGSVRHDFAIEIEYEPKFLISLNKKKTCMSVFLWSDFYSIFQFGFQFFFDFKPIYFNLCCS